MKKSILILSVILLGLTLIISCSDDEPTVSVEEIKLSTSSLSLNEGEKKEVIFTGGSGTFDVKSSDINVATVNLEKGKLIITAKGVGKAVITIIDKVTQKEKTIEINSIERILDIKIEKVKISIKKGDKEIVKITAGSGEYEAKSSDADVSTAEIKEDAVILNALSKGEATIVVTDVKTKKTATIQVVVSVDDLILSKEDVSIKKGEQETITIKAGSGEYKVESKNKKVVEIKYTVGEKEFTIVGLKKGTAKVVVTDTEANKAKEINVTVTTDDLTLIESENDKITLREEATAILHIIKGSGNYEVISKNTEIATAELKDNNVIIKGISSNDYTAKHTEVIVKDIDTDTSKIFKVAVFKKLSIGTKVIEVIQGSSMNTAFVSGDKEHLSVKILDPTVASYKIVEVSGFPEIEFTGLKPGTTEATVTDGSAEVSVSITVKGIEPLKIFDTLGNEVVNTVNLSDSQNMRLVLKGSSGHVEVSYDVKDIISTNIEFFDEQGSLTIYPISEGTVVVTFTDSVSGDVSKLTVVVKGTSEPLEVSVITNLGTDPKPVYSEGEKTIDNNKVEGSIKIAPNKKVGFDISKGKKPYAIEIISGDNITKTEISNEGRVYINAETAGVAVVKISGKDEAKYYEIIVEVPPIFTVDSEGKVLPINGVMPTGNVVLPDNAKIVPNLETLFKSNEKIISIDFGGVEKIERMSVMGCDNLISVELRNVTNIGMGAFANCSNLKQVHCSMATPPSLGNMAFNKASVTTLYVPQGSKQAYIDAGFDNFKEIVEK